MIDLTATDLTAKTAVELRKIGAEAGIKGASKGRKDELMHQLVKIQQEQIEAKRQEEQAKAKSEEPKRGICTECGRKEDFQGSGLCEADREYAESENAHGDEDHEGPEPTEGDFRNDCQVCHPELDRRSARRIGRSRAGMVIVAKGSEIHKSLLFKREAEAKGWTVEISAEEFDGGNTRHFADAHRGDEAIQLAWDGRAYDYSASSARLKGRSRKVRNLKEALRLI